MKTLEERIEDLLDDYVVKNDYDQYVNCIHVSMFDNLAKDLLSIIQDQWIEITELTKPNIEVVAINMKPGTYGYKEKLVGYIRYNENLGCFVCSDENTELRNVTHYLNPNFLPAPKEES